MTKEGQTRTEEQTGELIFDTGIGGMPFGRAEVLTEEEALRKAEALRYFKLGYEAQMREELDSAADLYQQSISEFPTAEAHTFLGWAYSFMGRLDEAIEECHRAIEVDPDFGNPYNDIGAYLIEQNNPDAAVPWLQRAKKAVRYESYFYPYFNLGRVFQARGLLFQALREYRTALDLNPNYTLAQKAFRKVQGMLN